MKFKLRLCIKKFNWLWSIFSYYVRAFKNLLLTNNKMARWKTLPYVFRCPKTGWILKSMDLKKENADKFKEWMVLYSPKVRQKVRAKCKQHKHSS